MIKECDSVIDDNLYSIAKNKLHLSIEVSYDKLSYSILHKDFRKYLFLKSFCFAKEDNITYKDFIRSVYKDNSEVKGNFGSISISYINNNIWLFPKEYFSYEKTDKYLSILSDTKDEDIKTKEFNNLNIISLFKKTNNILDTLQVFYDTSIDIVHSSNSFIEKSCNDLSKTGLFINISSSKSLEIIIKNSIESLEFYNNYKFKNYEEAIFILKSVILNFRIKSTENVYLYGDIDENSELYSYLVNTMENISFGEFSKDYLYSMSFQKLPIHKYFTLLNSY